MKTVRTIIICFNDMKIFSEAFRNTNCQNGFTFWVIVLVFIIIYIPSDMLDPKRNPGRFTIFVYWYHSHDLKPRRSVTWLIVIINKIPIQWHRNQKNDMKTSTYIKTGVHKNHHWVKHENVPQDHNYWYPCCCERKSYWVP